MPRFWCPALNAIAMALALVSADAQDSFLRVPSDFPTIQAAVNNASLRTSPVEVLIAPGVYEQLADIPRNSSFTIRAEGPVGSVVWRPPTGQPTALSIPFGAVAVDGITFQNAAGGNSGQSAVVRITGSQAAAIFRECEFIGISSREGAVYVRGAAAFFERCSFSDNRAATAANAPLEIGAAIQVDFQGTADLLACELVNNRAAEGGAIAVYNGGALFARDCVFRGNIAASEPQAGNGPFGGGAVAVGPQRRSSGTPATATFIACEFTENEAGRILQAGEPIPEREPSGGGAIASFGNGRVRAIDCRFEANSAREGGAVAGVAELVGCLLAGNIAERGGAVAGLVTFRDCTVERNLAEVAAAWALRLEVVSSQQTSVPPRADRTVFRRNAATQSAGVMSLQSTGGNLGLVTESCVFEENQAQFDSGVASGNLSMAWVARNCLITRNRLVQGNSGAVSSGVNAEFIHCSIVGNFSNTNASNPQAGGPILTNGRFSFLGCVVAGNYPDFISGTTTAANTIFGPLMVPPTIDGPGVQYRDPEFALDPSAGLDGTLGTFDDIAGDLRPGDGSPLIDAGDVSSLTFGVDSDASGLPRRIDDPGVTNTGPGLAPHPDIGALERQGPSTSDPYAVVCRADLNADGITNLFDVLAFFAAFGAQSAQADFAEPIGTLDLFDILGFFQAFSGC